MIELLLQKEKERAMQTHLQEIWRNGWVREIHNFSRSHASRFALSLSKYGNEKNYL